MKDNFGPTLAIDHEERIDARAVLLRSARHACRAGLEPQQWQDHGAAQWALDALPQVEIDHLKAFVWSGEL